MNYTTEIKQYISQLKTNSGNPAGVQERTRTRNILIAFCDYFDLWHDSRLPDESDFDAFRKEINKPENPKFATENINRAKKFFAWLEIERKNAIMTDNSTAHAIEAGTTVPNEAPETLGAVEPETLQASEEPEAETAGTVEEHSQGVDDETSTEITAPIEPEETTENQPEAWPEENTTPAPVKKKPGRKRFDTVNGEKKSEKLMLYLTPELIAKIRVWCDMKGISNVSFITGLIEDFLKDKEDKINAFLKMRSEL